MSIQSIIGNNVQGSTNPSMVSLHHAVPIEIRSSSSTSSASSSIKSGASNKNGKILINTRGHSSSIPAGQQNLPKGVPSYFVTDPDDEGIFAAMYRSCFFRIQTYNSYYAMNNSFHNRYFFNFR